ncbi:ATP synthase F1 subunit delta [Desulfarculus baarsii]
MTSFIVAKRYAKALLELGREDGNTELYGKELGAVAQMLADSAELESALVNPGFDFDSRKKLLAAILQKLGVSPMVANFFRLLMDRGRIAAARDIALTYGLLLDEVNGVTRAEVRTAAALNEEEVKRLTQSLKSVARREVALEVIEDPSLIGGVVAKIGDLVLDGSVKTQLANLKESLRRGDYA